MTINPTALLALARAASSGPWKATPCTDEGDWRVARNHDSIVCCTGGYPTGEPDAAFIAACSPDVIVALCERIEDLERDRSRIEAERDSLFEEDAKQHDEERPIRTEVRLAKARIEALEAGLKRAAECLNWIDTRDGGSNLEAHKGISETLDALRLLAEGKP